MTPRPLAREVMALLVDRFDAVESRCGGYVAKCPTHNDTKPSFTINIVNDKVVFGCWICTPPGTAGATAIKARMLRAVGLGWKDVFGGSREAAPRKIVKVYDYYREDWSLAYQQVRYDPKDFRPRRKWKGKWAYGLEQNWYCQGDSYSSWRRCKQSDEGSFLVPGVPMVLYRLPQLLAANVGRPGCPPVAFVEGEKDADRLWSLGIPATTRICGSKSPWQEDYNGFFRNKDVVYIPDNDKAGRDGAAEVAGRLIAARAASVSILELPGVAEKGDVSKWLDAGGTADELRGLMARGLYRRTSL